MVGGTIDMGQHTTILLHNFDVKKTLQLRGQKSLLVKSNKAKAEDFS